MSYRIALALLFAACVAAGCSNHDESSAAPAPSASPSDTSPPPVYETPAAADPYPGIVDATCEQFADAYTGEYDLGKPPNEWAGSLLAVLVGQDGIQTTLTGFIQVKFAMAVNLACLDPAMFPSSARDIGAAEYRAHKTEYVT